MSASKSPQRFAAPTIPELEQSKKAVLDALVSAHSRRAYKHAIEGFTAWYCSEPRIAFNRLIVVRYRSFLESQSLSPATVNLHLSAVRRLADEAADGGWLSPELAIGIRRVKSVKRLGKRLGNWLNIDQAQQLLRAVPSNTLRGKRDAAIIGLLLGCGLRRSEVVALRLDQFQSRENHNVIVDLVGKGGRLRTVPVPTWCNKLIDAWLQSAHVTQGKVFQRALRAGPQQETEVTTSVVWCAVKRSPRESASLASPLMTFAALALDSVTTLAGNWSKFSSFLVTHPCKRRSGTSDVVKTSEKQSTTGFQSRLMKWLI